MIWGAGDVLNVDCWHAAIVDYTLWVSLKCVVNAMSMCCQNVVKVSLLPSGSHVTQQVERDCGLRRKSVQ